MSVFSILIQKYGQSLSYISPSLTNPVPPSAGQTQHIQNGGPESSRLTLSVNKCSNVNPSKLIPVLVQPVPASATIAKNSKNITDYSQINIVNVSSDQAQQILFGKFFPPSVPPPQFLQVPPTRSNNEPYARQPPCIGPHRWDTS